MAWPRDEGQPVAVRTENRPDHNLPPLPDIDEPTSSSSTTVAPPTSSTRPVTTAPSSPSTTARPRPSPTTVTTKAAAPTTTLTAPIAQPVPPTTTNTTTTRPFNPKAPRALSMTVSPKELDTSAGPAKLTVRLRMVDDQGDAVTDGTTVRFTNGDGFRDVPYEAWKRISGDGHDGVYEATFDLEHHTAQGLWSFVVLRLNDEAGNARSQWASESPDADFDDGFTQLGPGDPNPPRLKELTVAPNGSSVTFTARITDTPAGVATTMSDRFDSGGTVLSPSGQEYNLHFGWGQVIAGTKYDATYRFVLNLGPAAEQGTWTISRIHLGDILGNQTNLETSALAYAGFPTSFVVGG